MTNESSRTTPGDDNSTPAVSASRGAIVVGLAILVGILLLQIYDRDGGDVGKTVTGAISSSSSSAVTNSSSSSTATPPVSGTLPGDTSGSSSPTTGVTRAPADIKVSVLNAKEVAGVAKTTSDTLQAAGYATLTPGNAPAQTGTTVHCKAGFESDATALATATGIAGATVQAFPASVPTGAQPDAATADCFIILGK